VAAAGPIQFSWKSDVVSRLEEGSEASGGPRGTIREVAEPLALVIVVTAQRVCPRISEGGGSARGAAGGDGALAGPHSRAPAG
jgi:hypothetical protein